MRPSVNFFMARVVNDELINPITIAAICIVAPWPKGHRGMSYTKLDIQLLKLFDELKGKAAARPDPRCANHESPPPPAPLSRDEQGYLDDCKRQQGYLEDSIIRRHWWKIRREKLRLDAEATKTELKEAKAPAEAPAEAPEVTPEVKVDDDDEEEEEPGNPKAEAKVDEDACQEVKREVKAEGMEDTKTELKEEPRQVEAAPGAHGPHPDAPAPAFAGRAAWNVPTEQQREAWLMRRNREYQFHMENRRRWQLGLCFLSPAQFISLEEATKNARAMAVRERPLPPPPPPSPPPSSPLPSLPDVGAVAGMTMTQLGLPENHERPRSRSPRSRYVPPVEAHRPLTQKSVDLHKYLLEAGMVCRQ